MTSKRLEQIDILRGVAIAVILFVHLHVFAYGAVFVLGWSSWLDQAVAWLVEIGANNKFNIIFAFLFGLSTVWLRPKGLTFWLRRMAALMLIGLVHRLIWDGDILFIYAAIGFYLPLVWDWPAARQVRLGIGLLALPMALFAAYGLIVASGLATVSPSVNNAPSITQFWPRIAGMMLLGMAAGKSDLTGWGWRLGYLLPAGLAVTVAASILKTAVNPLAVVAGAGLEVPGSALLGLAYVGLVLAYYDRIPGRVWLAAVGRLGLTNYLGQTLTMMALFWALGLWLPPSQLVILGVLILALQAAFSRVWLANYSQGPVEMLWRRAAVGRAVKPSHSH